MICPILTISAEFFDCQEEKCAWYDQIDYRCVIVTIADNLANIHGHAREMIARAYGFNKALEDIENEKGG